jgi:adenylate kinase family enzyme
MKIHIVGGSGTGKSYISEKISKQYQIPHFDLDNIFWDNEALSYGIKMPIDKRTEKLNEILEKDNWIIEGVFYGWLYDSFALADYIFILKTKPIVYNYRIIRRFIRRKLGLEKAKKETLKSLKDLLIWTNKYQKKNIPKIVSFLEQYHNKVIMIDKAEEILGFINHIQ